ncbi:hypothetical protein CPAV1605_895 [seawater metagenome]|uniref:Helicase ATP-binding domain-containing protein n=1 Tax=seawater metagenome TaxID=1561972 RepID=A0A5E8CME6_9ZZZZ
MSKDISKKELEKLINKEYSYPNPEHDDFQSKIFKKREFYYHKIPPRQRLKTYEDIKEYRDLICSGDFQLREQQTILANFIAPNTPYKGVLVFHGTGTGKTCSAIAIGEQFKDMVKKYNTKIHILSFGPNNKETFKNELLVCTGETYLKNKENLSLLNEAEITREKKIAVHQALQYYKIMSYKTFYKKVLGEKIVEKKLVGDNKIKSSYRKTEEGAYEREIVVDRIHNLNNTVLIVDEAHNLTGNEYGEALKKIIKESENLRIVLLTATPMKNLGDDIVELLNFIRPKDSKIQRDKIFTSDKNHNMKFKEGGIEYLKKMANGYVSFFRGSIPYTFAKRVDKGVIPKDMLFTPVILCYMKEFQLDTYEDTITKYDDTLDRKSSAVANFVFPGLSSDKKSIVGYYSADGINLVKSQLKTNKALLLNKINKKFFNSSIKGTDENNILYESEDKILTGYILKKPYLKFFSIKFYKCLKRLEKLVLGKKGPGIAFIYSNLVKVGIDMFQEILIQNGYLEYEEDKNNYDIKENTIDYRTGMTLADYKKSKERKELFMPAVFMTVTGKTDDNVEIIPEVKQKIIREVFNNVENKDGRYIKFILGSKVMNESVTLENIREVHILDVHYNLGKVDQVIGRAIRQCKHQNIITDEYRFPKVNIYRYVVALKNKLSTEEELYLKAEKKYILIKQVERALKQVALDCPLLQSGNVFQEEVEKYKSCVEPTLENKKKGKLLCPAICDFMDCEYKCEDKNLKQFIEKYNKLYKKLEKKDLDYNTFNDDLASHEIETVKEYIKDMYRFKHVYTLPQILEGVKSNYSDEKKELFDDYFVYKALDELVPKTENEFNNFKDTIYDKFSIPGYLIHRDKYYIFQPFDQNEDVPMYYREIFNKNLMNDLTMINYMKSTFSQEDIKKGKKKTEQQLLEEDENDTKTTSKKKLNDKVEKYDFETNKEYYHNRDENEIVGIIDKNYNRHSENDSDLFKIRGKRSKILIKKRGTGIPTLKGAVCSTSKDKDYLINLLKKMPNVTKEEIKLIKDETRINICEMLKIKLLFLEKYSIGKEKITYVIIPSNHPKFDSPYNLEDRIEILSNNINKLLKKNAKIDIKKEGNGIFLDKRDKKYIKYNISLKNSKDVASNKKKLEELGGKLNKGGKWDFTIE